MEESKEKFTIEFTDRGIIIFDGEGRRLEFTASEALMLLDILKNEESTLKEMAEDASPIPIKIKV